MKTLLASILFLLFVDSLHSQSIKLQLGEEYIIDIAIKSSNQAMGFYYGDQDNTEITYFDPESRDYNYRIPIPTYLKERTFNKVLFHLYKFHGYGDNSARLTINELAIPLTPYYEKLGGWNQTPPLNPINYDTVTISPGGSEWITFDVTNLFLSWLHGEKQNNGFAVKPLDEHSPTYFSTFYWQSTKSDPALRPYFELFGPNIVDTLITTSDYKYDNDSTQEKQTGWAQQPSGTSNTLLGATLIDVNSGFVVGADGIILATHDEGKNWISQNSGTQNYLRSVSFIGSSVGIVVGDYGTILRTTNGGNTWQSQISGTTTRLNSIQFLSETNGIAVGGIYWDTSVVLRTTDAGISWTTQPIPPCDALIAVSFGDENNGVSVGYTGGLSTVLHTTDGGINWTTQAVPMSGWLYGVHFINTQTGIIVGEFGTVMRTIDGGISWKNVSVPFQHYYSAHIFDSSNIVLAGAGLLIRTTNGGQAWTETGANQNINGVYFRDNFNGIAVGDGGTILTTASGGLTNVERTKNEPTDFELLQNYPNPFNPTTCISFSIRHNSLVTLKIFNLLGQEVATLTSRIYDKGKYQITWDAGNYPSGVYFCRLQADDNFQTKKLSLLK